MNLNTMIYPSDAAESTIRMLITPGHSFPATTRNGIILHGPFGTGKSTCAKLLPAAIEAKYSAQTPNVRYENCMPGNNGVGLIESIHNQGKSYPTSGSFHYVILDEADNLTSDAMKQLKSVMNSTDSRDLFTTAFIMTTNHLDRIDEGVRSRSHCISFAPENMDVWIPLVRDLLAQHGVPNASRICDSVIRTKVIDHGNDPRSIRGNSETLAIQLKDAIAQRQIQSAVPVTL
jgi:replication-associated recombination protein RarA